mmetsp:Transcript_87912/g.210092  ORF Transcript_87912/g.210092 Transcript_87912/m.210092 type:complete len:240 (-) Transcript_87912:44-763(-)
MTTSPSSQSQQILHSALGTALTSRASNAASLTCQGARFCTLASRIIISGGSRAGVAAWWLRTSGFPVGAASVWAGSSAADPSGVASSAAFAWVGGRGTSAPEAGPSEVAAEVPAVGAWTPSPRLSWASSCSSCALLRPLRSGRSGLAPVATSSAPFSRAWRLASCRLCIGPTPGTCTRVSEGSDIADTSSASSRGDGPLSEPVLTPTSSSNWFRSSRSLSSCSRSSLWSCCSCSRCCCS